MSRFFLQLSYFGKHYNGWQIQKNTPQTVQETIEKSLSTILRSEIEIVGCGRTDTGVHAKNYFAHFDFDDPQLTAEKKHWLFKFNKISPNDIVFEDLFKVKNDASARFDALSRTYEYHIHQTKNAFMNDVSWYNPRAYDLDKMNQAASLLMRFNDFTSFSKVNTQTRTNICTIKAASWKKIDHQLCFTITADRFLRNMVRSIVGTLIDVGSNKITLDQFVQIIESKNRSNAGASVPAHGLFLSDICYSNQIFLND